jgi:hypothetical protein
MATFTGSPLSKSYTTCWDTIVLEISPAGVCQKPSRAGWQSHAICMADLALLGFQDHGVDDALRIRPGGKSRRVDSQLPGGCGLLFQ